MDVVEFGADTYAHMKQVYVKQLYNQVPQTAWVSQFEAGEFEFQLQLEIGCPQSENQLQTEGLGPQRPTVEQPSQDEEGVLLWSREEL